MFNEHHSNLVAGHPSAVKAGGMRIVQNKQPSSERPAKDAEDCTGLTHPVSVNTMSVSRAHIKGNSDYSTDAVQVAHSPKSPHSFPSKPLTHIQQPRDSHATSYRLKNEIKQISN